jgi:hypothetical protein
VNLQTKERNWKIQLRLYCYSKIQIQLYQLHWKFNTETSNSIEIKLRTNLLTNNWRYNNRVLKLKLRSIGFLTFFSSCNESPSSNCLFLCYISQIFFSLSLSCLLLSVIPPLLKLLFGLYRQLKWCIRELRPYTIHTLTIALLWSMNMAFHFCYSICYDVGPF